MANAAGVRGTLKLPILAHRYGVDTDIFHAFQFGSNLSHKQDQTDALQCYRLAHFYICEVYYV